jgi:acyl-CoA dehydrogenase
MNDSALSTGQAAHAASQSDPLLLRLADEIFALAGTRDAVSAMESGTWPREIWQLAADAGLPLLAVDDELGGSGGSLLDVVVMLEAAGRHAVPLPLAETNIAAWLLSRAGQPVPNGPATFIPGTALDTLRLQDGVVSGVAHDIPWAESATAIVGLLPDETGRNRIVSLDASQVATVPGRDIADLPRSRLIVTDIHVADAPIADVDADTLVLRAMLARTAQMAGCMEAINQLTLKYSAQREQFGRPIRAFQSVQQHLVTIAQFSALSKVAVERAAICAVGQAPPFETLAAKQVANMSAEAVARAAHQAHGAIGMTREYELQYLTRRLFAWRGEFGTGQEVSARLGQVALSHHDLYRLITAG